jgi:RimJ/RimL family protein N-acetyltransferase
MLAIRSNQLSILEQECRRQIAQSVLAELRRTTPHAVAGLSSQEIDDRLETAIAKSIVQQLDTRDDIEAFVRVCFIVGSHFDEYPPFRKTLASHDSQDRIPALFSLASTEDWNNASQFDIVRRYRKMPHHVAVSLTPLHERHAEPYWRQALHPDVWRLGRMKPMVGVEDVLQKIRDLDSSSTIGFAIVDRKEQLLGAIFAEGGDEVIGVSYWVARPAWGQGIASQALMQLKAIKNSEKLMLAIDPGNSPSVKVATNCGFLQTDSHRFVA